MSSSVNRIGIQKMQTVKPRAKALNELLMRKGHAVHKDARRPARSNAKAKLRQEY